MTKTILFLLLISTSYAQECISHRAHIDGHPENSIEALESVVQQSFEGVEIDIQISKDGIAFLYHDSKLGKGLKGELCPIGTKIDKLNFNQFYNDCFLENGSQLATFEESLTTLSEYSGYIFIDLKKKPNHAFYRLFEESNLFTNVKVKFISFKKRALRPLKKRWPQSNTILLSRFIPRGLFYQGIGFNKRLNSFASFYHRIGKDVGIWTLNEKHEILEALDRKANYIITDEYQLCLDLKNN